MDFKVHYFYFDLLILTSFITAMNAWAKMYKKCAERDGKISCGEKFGMAVNSFSTGAMSIVEFAMMIWVRNFIKIDWWPSRKKTILMLAHSRLRQLRLAKCLNGQPWVEYFITNQKYLSWSILGTWINNVTLTTIDICKCHMSRMENVWKLID